MFRGFIKWAVSIEKAEERKSVSRKWLLFTLPWFFALAIPLAVFGWSSPTQAQQGGANALEDILERLDAIAPPDGSAPRRPRAGPFGSRSPLDEARRRGARGEAISPFSSGEVLQIPELNTRFDDVQLILIERFCRGEVNPRLDRIIRTMLEFSRLEREYCRRVSDKVLLYGYHVFDGPISPEVLVNGSIPDDYILGIGDELVISFRGTKTGDSSVWVDREGRIKLDETGPIPAANRSFGEFRQAITNKVKDTMLGTDVTVSLGSVRLVSVNVSGEVRRPGVHRLTGLSTVFDALASAGGVRKTGSLRRIQVQRGDQIFWIDIYELLFSDIGNQNFGIRDGDTIIVPTLGSVVAVTGDVKRMGIFEMAEGQTTIDIASALALAGGAIRPRGNVYSIGSLNEMGLEVVTDGIGVDRTLREGDVLTVQKRQNLVVGAVELAGHVAVPGRRALSSAPTLRALIGDANTFKDNPYLLFAALETTDPATRARRLFPIHLQNVVSGRQDFALRDGDRLIVLGNRDVQFLSSEDVRRILTQFGEQNEGNAPTVVTEAADPEAASQPQGVTVITSLGLGEEQIESDKTAEKSTRAASLKVSRKLNFACKGLQSLSTIMQLSRTNRFAGPIQAVGLERGAHFLNPLACPPVFESYPDLLPFALEHVVSVNGEVRSPGAYPVTTGTNLALLVAAAGGLSRKADLERVEISSSVNGNTSRTVVDLTRQAMQSININPGDVARFDGMFSDRDSGPILLSGEFVRPGLYDIRRGERLSEVIARAGGLTNQAYPYGAVFLRDRVKKAQKAAFQRTARELKSAAIFAANKKGVPPSALAALQQITKEITSTEPLGRVVIDSDPVVLQVRPELDTVMEPGDKLFMPKRPNSVLVVGNVLNPGALQFVAGTKVDNYVQQAGGFQQSADEDRMFLVYPNGVAQPISVSVWNYNPVQVPPGSTIVVPSDPSPIDLFDFAREMTQLLSQLAITAASLAVIGNN